MSDLQRPPGHTPRRVRERRAYRLVVVGGTASLVAVIGLVLAVLGVVSAALPIMAILVGMVCALLFRRLTSP